jgi:hypothetical protein
MASMKLRATSCGTFWFCHHKISHPTTITAKMIVTEKIKVCLHWLKKDHLTIDRNLALDTLNLLE